MLYIRLIFESFRFSMNALRNNLLRTMLSLFGVTVGVFMIIAVLTVVNSLESSIKSSFNFLGDNVLSVDKWPYGFSGEYPWWRYVNRPQPTYEEYEFLRERLVNKAAITIISDRSGVIVKRKNNSFEDTNIIGLSDGYNQVREVLIGYGRYFTEQEIESGAKVVVIGHDVATALFPIQLRTGDYIKIKGIKFKVVGIMPFEGESFLGFSSNDINVLMPFYAYNGLFNTGGRFGIQKSISIKGLEEDIGLMQLEWEARGLMRNARGLKPKEGDNFALNRTEAISQAIGASFVVLEVAGWFIGAFSMIIGAIGIANIMFVSVKERTPLIGIQKSLGAKTHFILFQFLFEAVFLSLLGGLIGLILVYLISFINLGTLDLVLTANNIILGLTLSSVAGVVSGIIPAYVAARLDPVIAIRS